MTLAAALKNPKEIQWLIAPTRPGRAATLSSDLVDEIRTALFEKRLKPGDHLGGEKDIAARSGVSRIVARDALRTLEALGIVEIKVGAGGGARIARGDPRRFAEALAIQLELAGTDVAEIMDAQRAVESLAAELAAETENPASTSESAPIAEQTPTPEPTSWSAQAAIDAAPPSIWPAGNAATFAGVLDTEPQVASAEPSSSSDQNAATSNAVADPQPDPAVAAALEDTSNDNRDAWFEEILATLSGALAAGTVAWFLFGAAPRRRYG
jgi:DNA-binding transcriptional regulator YhcF (GntR family)